MALYMHTTMPTKYYYEHSSYSVFFSEEASTESAVLTPASRTARESLSECGADDGRSGSVYRCSEYIV